MIAFIAGIAAYSFPTGSPTAYDVRVEMSGFLPLLRGREGQAKLEFGMKVTGLSPDSENRPRVSHELTSFAAFFNESRMPFDLTNVKAFFPLTTVAIQSNGKVLATDAPKRDLPASIPGLDIQRLPELTYLPVELPNEELKVGLKWKFERKFNDAPIHYQAEVKEISATTVTIAVTFEQTATVLEDEELQRVSDRAIAAYEVKTQLSGGGTVVFKLKPWIPSKVEISAKSRSEVTGVTNDFRGERQLTTKLWVQLRPE